MYTLSTWLLALLCSAFLTVAPARADAVEPPLVQSAEQTAPDPVAAAERAIAQGTARGAELAEPYRALAIGYALRGDGEASRRAFTALLAVEPSFRLDRSAADDVRAPYLEARGFWQQHSTPFAVTAQLEAAESTLVLALTDPAALSARVQVRSRTDAGDPFVEQVLPTAPRIAITLPTPAKSGEISYTAALLDEHGNKLFELGSSSAPIVLREAPVAAAPAQPAPAPTVVHAPSRLAARVLLGVSLAVAGAAIAGAAVAHVKREELARRWNRGDCSGQGLTRGERCQSEHTRIQSLQRWMGSLYGVGGVALVTALVTAVVPQRRSADSGPAQRSVSAFRCGAGPGLVGIDCSARF